jgi:hypothetical protein
MATLTLVTDHLFWPGIPQMLGWVEGLKQKTPSNYVPKPSEAMTAEFLDR